MVTRPVTLDRLFRAAAAVGDATFGLGPAVAPALAGAPDARWESAEMDASTPDTPNTPETPAVDRRAPDRPAPARRDWTIRTYRPADAAAVRELYELGLMVGSLAGDDPLDLDRIDRRYFAHSAGHFWVAQQHHAQRLVGMVGLWSHDGGIAEVRRLRVHPDYHSRDLFEHLLDTVLAHCRRHGQLKVVFDTHCPTGRATPVLQRHGLLPSRQRRAPGKTVLEYYRNLYADPAAQPDRV